MPITWPRLFSSGPPELPEFTAASNCTSSMILPPMVTVRSRAETQPAVSVWPRLRPRGLPMVAAVSPTTTSELMPSSAAAKPRTSALSTAMSVWLS